MQFQLRTWDANLKKNLLPGLFFLLLLALILFRRSLRCRITAVNVDLREHVSLKSDWKTFAVKGTTCFFPPFLYFLVKKIFFKNVFSWRTFHSAFDCRSKMCCILTSRSLHNSDMLLFAVFFFWPRPSGIAASLPLARPTGNFPEMEFVLALTVKLTTTSRLSTSLRPLGNILRIRLWRCPGGRDPRSNNIPSSWDDGETITESCRERSRACHLATAVSLCVFVCVFVCVSTTICLR